MNKAFVAKTKALLQFDLFKEIHPEGFEPPTPGSEDNLRIG